MKKFLPVLGGLAGVVALAVIGAVAMVQAQPDHIHVERSVSIDAAAADLEPLVRDLKGVNQWSPWAGIDPNAQQTYSDPSSGMDAWYAWDGNDEVGAGKMTVIRDDPNEVAHRLEFIRPFESQAKATIGWEVSDGALQVVWSFDTDASFVLKAINLVASMDSTIGPDYEKGLASLKPLAEGAAATRMKAAEATPPAEAAAAEGGEVDENGGVIPAGD